LKEEKSDDCRRKAPLQKNRKEDGQQETRELLLEISPIMGYSEHSLGVVREEEKKMAYSLQMKK